MREKGRCTVMAFIQRERCTFGSSLRAAAPSSLPLIAKDAWAPTSPVVLTADNPDGSKRQTGGLCRSLQSAACAPLCSLPLARLGQTHALLFAFSAFGRIPRARATQQQVKETRG
jgi:hypothetical protein